MDIDRILRLDDAERAHKALNAAGYHRATAKMCAGATIRDLAWILGGASAIKRREVLAIVTGMLKAA